VTAALFNRAAQADIVRASPLSGAPPHHHQYAGAGPAQPTLSGRAHVSGGGMMVTGGKSSQSSQGARPLVEQWIAAC